MPVKYTKEQTEAANVANRKLVTIAAAGLEFQDAVSEDMEAEVIRFILDIRKRFRQSPAPAFNGVLAPHAWPGLPVNGATVGDTVTGSMTAPSEGRP